MMSAEQTYVMGSRIIGNNLANIFNRNLSYATEFFSYFNEIGNFEKMIFELKIDDEYYNSDLFFSFVQLERNFKKEKNSSFLN